MTSRFDRALRLPLPRSIYHLSAVLICVMSQSSCQVNDQVEREVTEEQAGIGETQAGEAVVGQCSDVSMCPTPPPLALFECEEDWVVEVIFTPLCIEGLCDMERRTRPQRDCQLDGQRCRDGDCLTPQAVQCHTERPCPSNQVCVYSDGQCGEVGADPRQGTCQPHLDECPEEIFACGCDGKLYPNLCAAHQAGVDQSRFGGCTYPSETIQFSCGQVICDQGSYCAIYLNDGEGEADYSEACVPPLEGCDIDEPSCETCVQSDSIAHCSQIGDQLIVTHSGG